MSDRPMCGSDTCFVDRIMDQMREMSTDFKDSQHEQTETIRTLVEVQISNLEKKIDAHITRAEKDIDEVFGRLRKVEQDTSGMMEQRLTEDERSFVRGCRSKSVKVSIALVAAGIIAVVGFMVRMLLAHPGAVK